MISSADKSSLLFLQGVIVEAVSLLKSRPLQQAIAALNAIGKPFSYVNIFEDQEVREGLKVYSNWPTFPQLYVKGELVGGCDILIEMYHSGELKELIDA